jgi:hypothetical protein
MRIVDEKSGRAAAQVTTGGGTGDGVELHDHRRKCFSRFEIALRCARERRED